MSDRGNFRPESRLGTLVLKFPGKFQIFLCEWKGMGAMEESTVADASTTKDLENGWSGDLEKESFITKDGTVDWKNNPADRRTTGGWKACPYILGNECCERLAYYGMSINLVVFLTDKLHQHNATASTNVTNWSGTCDITPLIGAFLADAYLGRYWTIAAFSSVYFVGMVLLTLSASVPSLKPPSCVGDVCPGASPGQIGSFYLALYLVALGTGGIKPCVSSFGADQFDDEDLSEKKYMTVFFNWFYFSINVGAMIASTFLVYIQQSVNWAWGFGIPAAAMGIAIVGFFIGSKQYRHQKPGGSPLTRIAQVIVAAIRNWRLRLPADETMLYEVDGKASAIEGSRKIQHTAEYSFLDKAAIENQSRPTTKWNLCTVTQVEEVKILLRIVPIWASVIVFSTVYAQMSTLFVVQGLKMDYILGTFKVPSASLSMFDPLSVLILVPIYDRLLVPFVRKYTGHPQGFTQLQRMGIGLVISTISMVVAAVLEIQRLRVAREKGLVDADDKNFPKLLNAQLSIFWQIPQYFIIGASEVFTFIGQLEFFYEQSPDAMRSLGSALSLATVALGNYLSSLLVTIVTKITRRDGKPGWIADNLNHGHINYFFWLLAALSVVNFLFYLSFAYRFKYKETK
ncbi:protein NRT1/ PTR FAMILY 8.2 [Selaginella moellendorffii]|nr:protein NRT1/ PTR FAMILY 8.2 [Selaginella moellendorffii]|eukprot:XP_002972318.2 protein NRT1/ PTR FAMILY 8.2 [Selaginella moellendorffii]